MGDMAYMKTNRSCHKKTRQGQAIGDLLDQRPRGSERWRGNSRATEVVYNDGNDQVDDGGDNLGGDNGSREVARVSHLTHDGKVGRCGRACEDECRHGCNSLGEGGMTDELPVRFPGARLRRLSGTILDTDADCNDEN